MPLRRFLFVCVAGTALLCAQTPTAPVIGARGVTNFFTQEPAPGIVALGGLMQINGLNLGPPEGITASDLPWPNYVYGVKLDSTRATTSDTLYVLDGVNGNAVTMPVPAAVTAFTNATLLEIPEINSPLVQTFDKLAGDQGFVLFNLDAQTAKNLPLPEGFASVGPPAGAAPASANAVTAARVIIANAQANTISAVAYTNTRQVGILVH